MNALAQKTEECCLPLKVAPYMSGKVQRFLKEKNLALSLVEGMGSPLNILFPQAISRNAKSFNAVYRELGLNGKIFVTHKPNKSLSLIRQAALEKVGLDVSSAGELAHGLQAGFHPDRIEATGPKNDEYLMLCLLHGITINMDNLSELRRIIALKETLSCPAPSVMIRLSMGREQKSKITRNDSTFGFSQEEARQALQLIKNTNLNFLGFSTHLGTESQSLWTGMFVHLWQMTQEAFQTGLSPQALNLGGGFPLRYAYCEAEWHAYTEALKSSVLRDELPLSWNDSGLGYHQEDGKLKGIARFTDHAPAYTGVDVLRMFLEKPVAALDNLSPAQLLSESAIDLYIEPGRSMYDQAGLTLARVLETRLSENGEQLVRLEMNRTNINAVELPLMTDPVILYRDEGHSPAPNGIFYIGNLCRRHDMIQYHRTFPDFLPEKGDVVAFINTAAYMMDFAENSLLHQPVAEKVAVMETSNGFQWQRDDLYNPLRFL